MTGSAESCAMLLLYSYPELFGLPDNNPYGLKVFAFLKLTKLPFQHENIFDPSGATSKSRRPLRGSPCSCDEELKTQVALTNWAQAI
jgi:hypothetical protein